jgi:DNA-binding MarR family transcriptional regulator
MAAATPVNSPGFLLWHATLRWQRLVTASLRPLELTHVQFVLLAGCWWLTREGEPPSQIELADHAGTDVKMTSQVLRKLEQRGLITRTQDTHDSRVRRLAVTRSGATLAKKAVAVVEAADAQYFADVADLDELNVILQRLAGTTAPAQQS